MMPFTSTHIIALAAGISAVTIAAVGIGIAFAPSRHDGSGSSSLSSSVDDGMIIDDIIQNSDAPSLLPSYFPTLVPSPVPTKRLSSLPSIFPTEWPTLTPPAPSDFPSASPTRRPIDPNQSFRLMMHWELEFMWQEGESQLMPDAYVEI